MIKEFTIATSHTLNLGHYESMKVEASVTVSVSESDNIHINSVKEGAQR